MASKEKERQDITGLDQAADRKEAEYDLVSSLLEAAEYKTSDDNITEVKIQRNGKFMFSVHIHPISDADMRTARKKATIYMPNPNGRKLPAIEKERDEAKYASWIIYLATTEEDRQKIWGNPAVMQKYGLMQPVDSIDQLLTYGEKDDLGAEVLYISGRGDDSEGENLSEESFRQSDD